MYLFECVSEDITLIEYAEYACQAEVCALGYFSRAISLTEEDHYLTPTTPRRRGIYIT